MKDYWLRLFHDERGDETVENALIIAVLAGILCAASAFSSLRIRQATAIAFPIRATLAAEHWNSESAFAEYHWRIDSLAERWASSRETVRQLVKNDPAVVKICHGLKKAHTTYIIAPAVAQKIHARLSGSDSPFDETHYRIQDLAARWALRREKVRLMIKDEPGVMKFRQGRRRAHTMYSVPESVARRIYTRLQNAA